MASLTSNAASASIDAQRVVDFVCTIATSFAHCKESQETWDEVVIELRGNIYSSYEWAKTWWEFYGVGKELRLFLCYAAGRTVGIVPIYIDSLGFGPLSLKVARLVGANIPPKGFAPPVDETWAERIFEAVVSQLFEKDHCDVLSFGPVSELQKPLASLENLCRRRKDLIGSFEVGKGIHSVFWLPKSMEDYYSSLSKNERKHRRKYELRLLKKEFETWTEVISAPEKVEAEFEHFVRQHTAQWHAEGKTGHFGAWPRALEFNRALVKAHGRLGRMRFVRIVANNEVIANQYTFALDDTYYWELPSRIVGEEWERFSLGPTGIVSMIEVGVKEGKTRLEGGLAHYDYKVRLGAKEYAVKTVRVVAHTLGAWWRVRIFSGLRQCVGMLYHKLWYRRIAPRLPTKYRRPQWMLWLRLDF